MNVCFTSIDDSESSSAVPVVQGILFDYNALQKFMDTEKNWS